LSEERAEKDMIVELFKDATSQLGEVESAYLEVRDKNPIDDPKKLLAALKRFSNSIQLIESSLKLCGGSLKTLDLQDVKRCRGDIRDILTDGGFPQRIDAAVMREWDVEVVKMREYLAHSMLKVNKA
jgi:hypothetical protein